MNIGVIGLGRMGSAIAIRLHRSGIITRGFDINSDMRAYVSKEGVEVAPSIEVLVAQSDVLWMLLPAGDLIDAMLQQILLYASPGKIIIDAGNSKYTDSIRRAKELESRGIYFVDCGTSGGIHGLQDGFCLMIGGDRNIYETLAPAFRAVSARDGYAYVGPSGAGHYVKMVHNGIEYGLMQAYAEGFHILKDGAFKDARLPLDEIAALWQNGSVIRSWLLELTHSILEDDQDLLSISGEVAESGMGEWTVAQAEQQQIPVDVIKTALLVRAHSRKTGGNYATKLVALMRNKFGGHAVKRYEEQYNEDN